MANQAVEHFAVAAELREADLAAEHLLITFLERREFADCDFIAADFRQNFRAGGGRERRRISSRRVEKHKAGSH